MVVGQYALDNNFTYLKRRELLMISDSVKIARINAQAQQNIANAKMLHDLLTNPVIESLLAALVIKEMEKAGLFSGFTGGLEAGALMIAVEGLIAAQQIAPVMPDILQSGAAGLGTLTKLIPLLAAGA